MNSTKWSAFKAGWPTAVQDGLTAIWSVATTIAYRILLPIAVLAALFVMMLGFSRGFWLTVPPKVTPLWLVWVTRAGILAVILGILYVIILLFVNHAIEAGQKKIQTGAQRDQEGCL